MVKVLSVNGKIPLVDGKAIKAQDGGGSTVELDTTLSEAGKAADAKAVGDALAGKQDTISDLATIRSGAAKGATALQSVPSTYRTATAQDAIDSGKVDKVAGKGLSTNDYTDAAKAKVDALAPVATSGNYNDLTNKPTIPTVLPNPHKLTINSTEYDGSADVQMTIEGGSGAGNAQSDWNQNDSTAADYVKNRPFYTDNPVETVLVEESALSFADNSGIYTAQFSSTFTPIIGNTYTVYWDSTAYECICVEFYGMPCLGNISILDAGSDTGEPFMSAFTSEAKAIYTKDTSASHTISISELSPKIVKIDFKYLPFLSKPSGEFYLTFSSPNSFNLEIEENTKTWDGTLEYFAFDETWTVWDGTNSLSATYNGIEYVLYLRGIGNTIITGIDGSRWLLHGSDIACIGNIEVLLDYATVESGEHPVMGDNCYHNMFRGCISLTQAPELPATTLADNCYRDMFWGCTSLTQAPALPATTLTPSCYRGMFQGCTNLTQIPELPATTLEGNCYYYMFSGCTSLKLSTTRTGEYTQEYRIPFFGNGTDAADALWGMFNSTGGTFTGAPDINTTYYLSSDNMIVRGTKLATLSGYVKAMIDTAGYIIPSSTEGSTKKFKITVDDNGTLSATEVTA